MVTCQSSGCVRVRMPTHRGLSSTVRRCVARDTGQEFAVKIIDKSQDEAITESIAAEMHVLNSLPKHKYISKS